MASPSCDSLTYTRVLEVTVASVDPISATFGSDIIGFSGPALFQPLETTPSGPEFSFVFGGCVLVVAVRGVEREPSIGLVDFHLELDAESEGLIDPSRVVRPDRAPENVPFTDRRRR